MVPPGNETAIAAEDIAEFLASTKNESGSSESSILLSRPELSAGFPQSSRPNLGQFIRNRPFFIVLSEQQGDEDRTLGDRRF
ncbi:hypothetical protein HNY73_005069 [Argiope bruennichi]|uniref:Uncharacterized protein n=1 Tax=Argiope bruennichi TaxID=94029 RepID=A0A8T0FID6_ARGBR|nr:hypothetical protein HNY73_005069 [Argiope bruennichi]